MWEEAVICAVSRWHVHYPPPPPPPRTAVHAAAFNDNVECLQLLLKENVEVNAVDAHGRTPLMMAANFGHTNAVGE